MGPRQLELPPKTPDAPTWQGNAVRTDRSMLSSRHESSRCAMVCHVILGVHLELGDIRTTRQKLLRVRGASLINAA